MDLFDIPELTTLLGLPAEAIWTEIVTRRGKAVWRVDCPGGSYAVRFFRAGWFKSAHKESHAMLLARAAGLPVAPVRASVELRGCPILLVDWCPGHDLYAELCRRPWAAYHLGAMFGEQQAFLHRVPVERDALPDWIDFFGPIDEPMRRRLRQAEGRWPSMLHLDYSPYNVAIDAHRISGVLDWTNARIGDPRADLARTWTTKLIHRSKRRHPLRRMAENWFFRAWWQGYVRIAGRPTEMPLFRAWAVQGLLHVELREQPDCGSAQLETLLRLAGRMRANAGLPKMSDENLLELAAA